jgi:hypothetical protein
MTAPWRSTRPMRLRRKRYIWGLGQKFNGEFSKMGLSSTWGPFAYCLGVWGSATLLYYSIKHGGFIACILTWSLVGEERFKDP